VTIDLSRLGAYPSDPTDAGVPVEFRLFLPDLPDGFSVDALAIHYEDRFAEGVPPNAYSLERGNDGIWTANVTIDYQEKTHFGQSGRYLYRYQLQWGATTVTKWFTDPFAYVTDDVGALAAFDTPNTVSSYEWHDDTWKVPELDQLVVYELQVEEFNATFDGVIDRLPYLASLGVTCLELLPVTSLQLDFDWGYGPLHFFAPNERWGGAHGLKRLVDACHAAEIAIILDVVFQHTADTFPYYLVYVDAGHACGTPGALSGPMMTGKQGDYGPPIDYHKPFSLQFANAVTRYWLEEFHVDGFRYDEAGDLVDATEVPQTWEPLSTILSDAYMTSLRLSRFTASGIPKGGEYSRIIQVPEYLNGPEVFDHTCASATWQDTTLYRAEDAARTDGLFFPNDDFPHALDAGFSGYPRFRRTPDIDGNLVDRPVAPFQYTNSHDHSHLVAFLTGDQFLTFLDNDIHKPQFHPLASRDRWYKLQPFVVALYTASGIPMLWQGQEFTDNYVLPPGGDARIHYRRDAHWEYFYDPEGSPLVALHRRLAVLRASRAALRSWNWYYFYLQSRPTAGVFAYHRFTGNEHAIVLLNFSDTEQSVTIPCPAPGIYTELVDAPYRATPKQITGTAIGADLTLSVASNYGYIYCSP
jgi:maltooligosyltrehalose trehalohydrolase